MSERRSQRAKTIGSVLQSIGVVRGRGIALVLVLGEFGFDLTPIIASAGVIGVAVGFGAQNLVKDFLSGVFMLLEDQYGVGDVVDLGAATGTVESVGLRVTTVRDYAGTVWYVRNGEVQRVGQLQPGLRGGGGGRAGGLRGRRERGAEPAERGGRRGDARRSRWSTTCWRRRKVLGVQGMTAETITLRLTVKVRPARQWAAQRELRRRIMAVFDEHGIVTADRAARRAIEGDE